MYIGFIYEWTNNVNGMKYLGSHKGTIDDGYTGSGYRFLNAVRKYGIDIFTRVIVEYVQSEEQLFIREQFYLTARDCANSKTYYNISPSAGGGDTGSGHKISKAHKIAFETGTRKAWNKGCTLTCNQKANLSIDTWEIITPDGDTLIVRNMLDFCKTHSLNPSTMSAVARGKRGHHHGYKCKKLTNIRNVPYEYATYRYLTSEEKNKINSESVKTAKRLKALPKIEFDGIIYNSLVDASISTGKSRYILIKYGKLLRNN
jgi:hypothetical protein